MEARVISRSVNQLKRGTSKFLGTRIFKNLLIISLFILIILLFTKGPLRNTFQIKEFEITGQGEELEYINPEKVEILLEKYKGENYFSVDISEIPGILTKSSSYIESAFIIKQFPSTLEIYIAEREPFLALQIDKDRCVLLTEEAYALKVEKASTCKNILENHPVPKLYIPDSKLEFEENSPSKFYTVNDISSILTIFEYYNYYPSNMNLRDEVLTITVPKNKEIYLSLNQDVDIQLQRFVTVIKEIEDQSIEFKSLDLRYERPVLTRK